MKKNNKDADLRLQVGAGMGFQLIAHPMKVVRDKYGRLWLCNADVDEEGDLEAQGAWRCGDLTFSCIQ